MKELVIVQPYIPSYRAAFFNSLHDRLLADDISLVVAAGQPSGDQAARGDRAGTNHQKVIRIRQLHVAGRTMDLGGSKRQWAHADAVILGLQGTSVDLYRAIVMRAHSPLRVGVWGHVGPFVKSPNAVDVALERWQMKHCDHVFAYTPAGALVATDAGIPNHKVTTVMNAVDTTSLEAARENVVSREQSLKRLLGDVVSPDKRYVGYVGALDASKRISFLAEALEVLWQSHPDVKLLVAGKGPEERFLQAAIGRGQVVMLGYADDQIKANMAAVVDAFVMPGRVGLVAVETLLLRKPLLTTAWKFHSVEIDYLTEGITKFTSHDDPQSFAELMGRHYGVADPAVVDASHWQYPTIEDMVENFAGGVTRMFAV
jgi:glycosyltransferase involved in cell wall biosynthesis